MTTDRTKLREMFVAKYTPRLRQAEEELAIALAKVEIAAIIGDRFQSESVNFRHMFKPEFGLTYDEKRRIAVLLGMPADEFDAYNAHVAGNSEVTPECERAFSFACKMSWFMRDPADLKAGIASAKRKLAREKKLYTTGLAQFDAAKDKG